MFERFTDRARKVMSLANQEAQRFNHEYIGPEHILLGLVKEGSGVGYAVLSNMGVDLRKVRLSVEKYVKSGPDIVSMGKLPQSPSAKKVLELSLAEAHRLSHNYIGTEHLLLGLLAVKDTIAEMVLKDIGLDSQNVTEAVLSLIGAADEKDANSPLHDYARAFNKLFDHQMYLKSGRSIYIQKGNEFVQTPTYELCSSVVHTVIEVYVGELQDILSVILKQLDTQGSVAFTINRK